MGWGGGGGWGCLGSWWSVLTLLPGGGWGGGGPSFLTTICRHEWKFLILLVFFTIILLKLFHFYCFIICVQTTEYTEWQLLRSGRAFHHDGTISPGWWGGGGALPPPFTISTITYKVVVYAPAERADTLPLFLLYPYVYSVIQTSYSAQKVHGNPF